MNRSEHRGDRRHDPRDQPRDQQRDQPQPAPTPSPAASLGGLPVEPLDPVLLAEVLDALATRQDHLDRLISTLADHVTATAAGGPWAWRHLTPEQARDLFTQLRDFVDWVIARYDLRGEAHTIPGCWYRHPVAVEELTALMVAWYAAYPAQATRASDAPAGWHERWLWPTLRRLNLELTTWTKCTGGTHQPPRPIPATTDPVAFTGFLDRDIDPGPDPDPDPDRAANRAVGSLDAATVRTLLATGAATALLPGDAYTPIRYQGSWYGVADPTTTPGASAVVAAGVGQATAGHWQPLDSERAARIDRLHARRTRATSPGSPPT
ncbi:MAG TPA: hypothetical protein VFJ97_04175 [Dermatophilaceae bacterium]|nr:hypothetical protein [Dermatophilaceae bacterium]